MLFIQPLSDARCKHDVTASLIRQERLIVVANIDLNYNGSRRDDLLLLLLLPSPPSLLLSATLDGKRSDLDD